MSWTGVIVLFSVFFFVVLLMILPRGVATQADSGEIEPGTPASAPSQFRIGRKFLWSAIASAVIVTITSIIMEYEIITIDDLEFLMPESLHTPVSVE